MDDLDTMKFPQLLQLAKAMDVPGRGNARIAQLRAGIRAARAERAATPAADDGTVITTPAGDIRVGSVIVASVRGGNDEQVTVLEVSDDIKNGNAGWHALERWGYADQVVRVVTF